MICLLLCWCFITCSELNTTLLLLSIKLVHSHVNCFVISYALLRVKISALAISPSGRLIASGQLGTISYKGNAAPIFVWDVETQRRVTALRGLTIRVNALDFSTDERFLCGMGEV